MRHKWDVKNILMKHKWDINVLIWIWYIIQLLLNTNWRHVTSEGWEPTLSSHVNFQPIYGFINLLLLI